MAALFSGFALEAARTAVAVSKLTIFLVCESSGWPSSVMIVTSSFSWFLGAFNAVPCCGDVSTCISLGLWSKIALCSIEEALCVEIWRSVS